MEQKRKNLPSGGWVELRDIKEISERSRRPITNALAQLSQAAIDTMTELQPLLTEGKQTELDIEKLGKLGISFKPADLKCFEDANDYCIVALVKTWSKPEPVTLETVLDLTTPDDDFLRKICAPASQSLFVDFSMSKESVEDVTSPFDHSNGSATSSPADSSSTSTSPSPSGESTDW